MKLYKQTMEIDMVEHQESAGSGILQTLSKACGGTPIDRRNNWRIVAWTLAWAVGLTVASFTLKGRIFHVAAGSLSSWVLALVPVVLFVGVLAAYLRFLRQTDELQRLIQLQALAVGFGAGILLLMHWELFELVGLPQMDPSDAAMVPIFAYVLSAASLAWRYR